MFCRSGANASLGKHFVVRGKKLNEKKIYFEDFEKDIQEIIIELLVSIIENKTKTLEEVK